MKVIVIVGAANAKDKGNKIPNRFRDEATDLVRQLQENLRFQNQECYREFSGEAEMVASELEMALLEWRKEEVLLFYIGHGSEDGWCLSGYQGEDILEYERLRLILCLHQGDLVLVNDGCYAMAAKVSLESHGNYLLLGIAPENMSGDGRYFIDYFLKNLKDGKPYQPKAFVVGTGTYEESGKEVKKMEVLHTLDQYPTIVSPEEYWRGQYIDLWYGNPDLMKKKILV